MTTYFYFLFLIVFSYYAKKKEFVCLFPCRSYSHTYTTFGVKTSMFAKPFIIFFLGFFVLLEGDKISVLLSKLRHTTSMVNCCKIVYICGIKGFIL